MGAGRWLRRAGAILVCFLLLLPQGVRGDGLAEDLSRQCTYAFTGGLKGMEGMLRDGRTKYACSLDPQDRLTVHGPTDLGTLVVRLCSLSSAFLLMERDGLGLPLRTQVVRTDAIALTFPLSKGCRAVEILPLDGPLRLSEVNVFGPGTVPDDTPHPAAALEKTDFLLVSAHPDDEWVFLGGVYPIYGGERGLAGTVVYMTLPNWERAHECIDGLWLGGVSTHPFFLGFPDVDQRSPKSMRAGCKQEDVTLALVRLYRRIRPLVVVTQDPEKGEYGHWQHILSARAAYDAVKLAADPAYDPESAATYGTWTVLKVYQHFAAGMSQVELPVKEPLAHYGGRTALQVARAAFKAHRTQQGGPFRPGNANAARGDIVHFGLTWSTVGPDMGNDLFEHIPAELLAGYVPLAPTPAPTQSSTPEPTPTPAPTATPEPASTPEPTPTPSPTFTPAPGPWDEAEEKARWAADHAGPLAAGVVGLLALAMAIRQLRRAHHKKREQ